MKRVKNLLITLAFMLVTTGFSGAVMAKQDEPRFHLPDLDTNKICKPYLAPPGKLQGPIPYPYNLICWPK